MSELMSNMELSIWPQMALIIFVGVFALIVRRTYKRSQKPRMTAMAHMPLEDD